MIMFNSVNLEETSTQQGRKSSKSTHRVMFENSISPDFGCGHQRPVDEQVLEVRSGRACVDASVQQEQSRARFYAS